MVKNDTEMTWKGNDGQVGNLSTRATGYILCVEKTGLALAS